MPPLGRGRVLEGGLILFVAVLDSKRAVGVELDVKMVVAFGVVIVFAEHINIGGSVRMDIYVFDASLKDTVVVADLFAIEHCAELPLNVPMGARIRRIPLFVSHDQTSRSKIRKLEAFYEVL